MSKREDHEGEEVNNFQNVVNKRGGRTRNDDENEETSGISYESSIRSRKIKIEGIKKERKNSKNGKMLQGKNQ